MSRRKQSPEQEFGSDSFLDVIANIVGILIILIVVVGMKVARQPQTTTTDGPDTPVAVMPDDADDAKDQENMLNLRNEQLFLSRITELSNMQQQALQLEQQLETMLTNTATLKGTIAEESGDRELLRLQLAAIRQKAERTHDRLDDAEKHHDQLKARLTVLRGQIDENNKLLIEASQVNAAALSQSELLDQAIKVTGFETLQLREVINNARRPAANANRLRHRLSPVGQKVEQGELHFRVAENRISYVPLEELVDRLKNQLQSRRSIVMRMPRYEGVIGPVSGYRMNYVVEREQLSPLESLQYTGGYRVGVSRWTIEPDTTIQTESIADAIRPGSRFRQKIEVAPPDSAVTVWIYPDSFGSFAPLREVAHGLQLQVAARPLPVDVLITGSPGGSQSTAQ